MWDTTAVLIRNYSGRDKLMRTVGYAAVLISGSTGGASAQSWYTFSRQVYAARAVHDVLSIAIFKDFLASRKIKYSPKKELDPVMQGILLVNDVTSVMYYSLEKVARVAKQIIPVQSAALWTTYAATWTVSLVTGILRSLAAIGDIRCQKAEVMETVQMVQSPAKRKEAKEDIQKCIADLERQEFAEVVSLVRDITDLLNAVNWLPKGFLWAGKLNTVQSGLCGTIASMAGLYRILM